ncbi:hypothetical protein [Aquimarina megaterium]|uniref:hypothetical protein n=1 Tax=Aquimarina megaterium TaxID=1443666 RepID=UPI0009430249|nr:hypothetical protein [Aquimarina megaterium]
MKNHLQKEKKGKGAFSFLSKKIWSAIKLMTFVTAVIIIVFTIINNYWYDFDYKPFAIFGIILISLITFNALLLYLNKGSDYDEINDSEAQYLDDQGFQEKYKSSNEELSEFRNSHKPNLDTDEVQTKVRPLSYLSDYHIRLLERRINKELMRLKRNSSLNLGIGIVSTTVAIISLGYVIFFRSSEIMVMEKFLMDFLPRLSFVIFIEFFAFFFLKLYKSNLEDIKYYNNEKTNIDFKLIALKNAEKLEDKILISDVVKNFISVDRNFKLDKDQSTIQLEKMKLDNEQNLQLSNLLAKAIDKLK